jgi:hypothetical protein
MEMKAGLTALSFLPPVSYSDFVSTRAHRHDRLTMVCVTVVPNPQRRGLSRAWDVYEVLAEKLEPL